jgi:hypothetical protein
MACASRSGRLDAIYSESVLRHRTEDAQTNFRFDPRSYV